MIRHSKQRFEAGTGKMVAPADIDVEAEVLRTDSVGGEVIEYAALWLVTFEDS